MSAGGVVTSTVSALRRGASESSGSSLASTSSTKRTAGASGSRSTYRVAAAKSATAASSARFASSASTPVPLACAPHSVASPLPSQSDQSTSSIVPPASATCA